MGWLDDHAGAFSASKDRNPPRIKHSRAVSRDKEQPKLIARRVQKTSESPSQPKDKREHGSVAYGDGIDLPSFRVLHTQQANNKHCRFKCRATINGKHREAEN